MSDKTSPTTASAFDRRSFIAAATGAAVSAPFTARGAQGAADRPTSSPDPSLPVSMTLRINGEDKFLMIEARTTVLDAQMVMSNGSISNPVPST